eukprot:CAMPEP_0197468592 /NCGR_PEP_ID=MMETSP1175-20131217/66159_1 /TAXON_ID=1003142 /ORGANISM="Triceratium dubium, Strain CCMP147" /LENGTH=465 /DNA_ID=CAMNT_0043004695 /DNA_START=65 /DNA_END=1462 /DNA_ORIENTATION=+
MSAVPPCRPLGDLVSCTSRKDLSQVKIEVAFASVPMLGHMMPLLPLAEELIRRGHRVTFFLDDDPKYRRKLLECGLGACEIVAYSSKEWPEKKPKLGEKALFDCVVKHYRGVEGRKAPAVVVYEFFAVGAADAADALGVPAVGVFPNPLSLNPWAATVNEQGTYRWSAWCAVFSALEGILARLLWCRRAWTRWSLSLPLLPEQDFYPSQCMPRPMIGCASPSFEFPISCSPLFSMVGPALTTLADPIGVELGSWLAEQNKPIVYVAFGTMFRWTDDGVRELEAQLLELDVAVIWSLSAEHATALARGSQGSLPPHWKVEPFVPQVSLFRTGRVQAFITHCGSNSVNEALLCGVPMVCRPGFADQPANATRVARAGVGVIAQKSNTVGVALRQLLGNESDKFRKNSKELSRTLQSLRGSHQAATVVEDIACGSTSAIQSKWGRFPWVTALLGSALSLAFLRLNTLK